MPAAKRGISAKGAGSQLPAPFFVPVHPAARPCYRGMDAMTAAPCECRRPVSDGAFPQLLLFQTVHNAFLFSQYAFPTLNFLCGSHIKPGVNFVQNYNGVFCLPPPDCGILKAHTGDGTHHKKQAVCMHWKGDGTHYKEYNRDRWNRQRPGADLSAPGQGAGEKRAGTVPG